MYPDDKNQYFECKWVPIAFICAYSGFKQVKTKGEQEVTKYDNDDNEDIMITWRNNVS